MNERDVKQYFGWLSVVLLVFTLFCGSRIYITLTDTYKALFATGQSVAGALGIDDLAELQMVVPNLSKGEISINEGREDLNKIYNLSKAEIDDVSELDEDEKSILNKLKLAHTAYNLMYYVTLIGLLVTLITHILNVKNRGWIVPGCYALWLIVSLLACSKISSYIATMALEELYFSIPDPKVLTVTPWAYLTVVAAAGSCALWYLYYNEVPVREKATVMELVQRTKPIRIMGMPGSVSPGVNADDGSGWTCSCGAKMKAESAFCTKCGKKRPEVGKADPSGWICPTCGAKMNAESMFCTKCGTKKPGSKQAEPQESICPYCSRKISPTTVYCPGCGKKINGGPDGSDWEREERKRLERERLERERLERERRERAERLKKDPEEKHLRPADDL